MKIDTKIYLDKFKPRDFQYQLFDAFENKKIRKLVCVWPRRCLAGDTQIIMANGSWKELKDVSVGDQILSWNGEGFEPDVVEDSWKTEEKETVLIKSPNALPLTSSLDHKFAYLKTTGKTLGKCGNNEIIVKSAEWSKAKDVRFKRVLTYSGSEGNVNDPVLAKQMGTATDVHKSLPSRVWDFDRESLLCFLGAVFSKIGSFKSELKKDHYCSGFELKGSLFKNFIFDIFWVFKKLQLLTKKPVVSGDLVWVLRIIDESTVEFLAENLDFQNSKITEALAPYIRRMDGLFKPVVKKVFGCIAAKPGKPERSGRMRLYDIRTRKNHNFIANGFVVHNSGKDICAFNLVIREALRTVGVYYYIFPSYSQARKVIWDSLTNDGQRFLDFIPPKLVSKTNSQEMKVTLESGSLIQLIGSDNIDCFDEKTEILSEDGWKLFKDLSKDERVATLVDGQLKYNVPTEHMEYDYSGDMYRISSKSIDMFVTPNHRFYVRSSKGFYKFKDISDPTIRHDSIPAKSSWKGEERETFHFPSVSRGSVYSSRGLDKRSLPMEDFVALLGIYLSEGCTFQNKENNRITITQQKPINKIKIANLLVRCNIKFSERKGNFNFNCRLMHSYFSQFGLQHKRYIPKGIKSLSPRYLKILLNWLVLGDGYKNDNNIGYYSTSKRLVDDIQEIVIKLGLSANITEKKQSVSMIRGRVVKPTKILYDLLIRTSCFKRLSSSNKNYISKESYIGKVYCVSVPSGVIKVRRNGKECWSGNSIVGSNPRGCVFSEYAIQDPRAYQFIRPILAANKGWALFVSCVNPETLVIGSKGLSRIKDMCSSRATYTDFGEKVWGLGGFHTAEQFYYGGMQKTLKITLESGYQVECTPIHPLWNGKEWTKAKDISIGDLLPVQYGQNVWGDGIDISEYIGKISSGMKQVDFACDGDDFFYLLGLIHADGNYTSNTICITNKKDPEIQNFLLNRKFRKRPDGIHYEYSSRVLCGLLESLGFKHGARNKEFPEELFLCTKQEMRSFIQGVFDGDGCSASGLNKGGAVKLTSTCLSFIKDLQVILLNFGIVSSLRYEDKEPTKLVKVCSRIYNLEITGHFAYKFYNEIGFRLKRKQKNQINVSERVKVGSGNVYAVDAKKLWMHPKNGRSFHNPSSITRRVLEDIHSANPHPYLKELLKEKFFYSKVKSIEESECEVFDFVIPETHSFFTNGIISHNTPRGKNHFWELYNIALKSEAWYCSKLTLEDTEHIDMEEIELERRDGLMSEDLIQQEYYTSFTMGVEGAYYAKYIDKMRVNNQIGNVPWEVGFKVHTAWDIGVRDSTTILFFQTIGQTVRIIDSYEKSKEGLEHYVNIINSKPYTYGRHIAPHDIRVKEFGSGMTRITKARNLGLNFTIANNISIVDGIESVRSAFSKIWIDQTNCKGFLKAIENYRQEYDHKRRVYKTTALHDWSSHFADCLRYLCISLPKTRDGLSPEELNKRYLEALYGEESTMPAIFRDKNSRY